MRVSGQWTGLGSGARRAVWLGLGLGLGLGLVDLLVDTVELDVGDLVVVDEHRLVRDEEEALVERVEEALDGLHRAADALALVVEGAAVEAARLDLLHLLLGHARSAL